MRTLFALTLLTSAAVTQNVLTVGPGGFAQIADAIVAATPGDVVQIAPGLYRPFVLNKGITLRSMTTSAVNVEPDGVHLVTTMQIPAGQHARICGLTFLPGTGPGHVVVSRGLVSFDTCSFNFFTATPALLVTAASVTAWSSSFTGRPAVLLQKADFAAVQCGMVGCVASPAIPGGNAMEVVDSSVQMAFCQVRGGPGWSPANAGHGLVAHGTSAISVSDSILAGGNGTGTAVPGFGVINNSSLRIRDARNMYFAGTNPALSTGASTSGLFFGAPLIGITFDPFVFRIGASNRVLVPATPALPVFLLASLSLQPAQILPQVAEPVWAPPGTVTLGMATATNGVAAFQLAIPNNPALRNIGLWLHAIGIGVQQVEISPPAGSIVR